MAVMAAAFVTPALQGASGTIALAFTILYVLSFALGTGPVPGLLAAELLPTSIRGALAGPDVAALSTPRHLQLSGTTLGAPARQPLMCQQTRCEQRRFIERTRCNKT